MEGSYEGWCSRWEVAVLSFFALESRDIVVLVRVGGSRSCRNQGLVHYVVLDNNNRYLTGRLVHYVVPDYNSQFFYLAVCD